MSESKSDQLNELRLNRIKHGILKAEEENLKTRERTNEAMVELIRRIIIDGIRMTY